MQIDLSQLQAIIKEEVKRQVRQESTFEYVPHRKAAQILEQTEKGFYANVSRLGIPVYKLGGRNYYRVSELKDYFKKEKR